MKYESSDNFDHRLNRRDVSEDRRRTFPLTDYHFHSDRQSAAGLMTGATPAELRGFRSLSHNFLNRENGRDYVRELVLFGMIVAISAWPIASMISALRHWMK